MVRLLTGEAEHGQAQCLDKRPDPQQKPPGTVHIRVRIFRIRFTLREIWIDATILVSDLLAAFGAHAFEPCSPMGNPSLRHHTTSTQADAPA